jgi:uncharacterized membrane protein
MNNKWLKAAAIRAVRTFFQAFIAAVGTSAVRLDQVDWMTVFSVSAVAAILSIATSLAGLPEVEE